MTVSITYEVPKGLFRNSAIRQQFENVALFVRDLWLARSPYASGAYASGLRGPGSIKISDGKIEVINTSKIAAIVEHGFRSYNLGMAMLRNGKGVRRSKEGYRYKMIHITPKASASTRAASVAAQVKTAYSKVMPIGMNVKRTDKYGTIKPYQPRKSLKKNIKGGPKRKGGPEGFLVVSEKAILQNPSKWQMPAREGRHLARDVQKEARPLVVQAIRGAIQAEQARQQMNRGTNPSWFKAGMTRNPVRSRVSGKTKG